MPTNPANDRYQMPYEYGADNYDEGLNNNLDQLAVDVPAAGTLSDRPDAGQEFAPDRYYAVDKGNEYYNTGSEWQVVSSLSPSITVGKINAIDYVLDGDSIADAIANAPSDGGTIVITQDYDPSVETLPITVDKQLHISGTQAFSVDKIDFSGVSGSYAFQINTPNTAPRSGVRFDNIGLKGAGFEIVQGVGARWSHCVVEDAPDHGWHWIDDTNLKWDPVCINCQADNAVNRGFNAAGKTHNLQLIACIATANGGYGLSTDNGVNVNVVGGNYQRNGQQNIMSQSRSFTVVGAYLEAGSVNDTDPARTGTTLSGDGNVMMNCYLQGAGGAGTSSNTDTAVVLSANRCHVYNCHVQNYDYDFIQLFSGATDCDVHTNSHYFNDATIPVNDNGTRTRSNGVIGGAGLSGADLSTTTGQYVGDVALDGSTNLTARWTGSAWQPSDGSGTI
jgi:hypothetical protein